MSTGHLQVRLLGPFEVEIDGRPVGPAGERRRGLLALLALEANAVVPVDVLVDRMWGEEPPASAVNVVQTYVSAWRKALGREALSGGDGRRLETVGAGYRLNLERGESDLLSFRDLLSRGRRAVAEGRQGEAADTLGRALQVWRGPALADLPRLPTHDATTRQLEDARLDAVEAWAAAALRSGGDVAEVAQLLSSARTREPLRESLTELLMWALAGSGRQAEALQAFDETRRLLRDDLGADPGRALAVMHRRVLAGDEGLQPVARPDPDGGSPPEPETEPEHGPISGPLAHVDSFHGRSAELAVVAGLLASHRLVTLTGAGGAGKSRLATEILAAEASRGGSAWFVELAPLRDHELAAATVAVAVGVQPAAGADALESVVTRLRTLEGLLVLDNLEHLPGAHRLVDRLHRETRHLRVLVTSREPMRIEGEQQFLVQPLEVPDAATESDLDALAAVDSVRLFLDRARAHDPTQALDAANAHDIAEIARRLDGLPLALEIAAPWMRLLTPGGLLERLAAPLDVSARRVDAPVRHRTLRDTITWSYELLPDEERELLRAVAVFAGSFTLEAAERVVPGVGMPARVDVAEGLFDLVDRHLVQPADPVAGRPRFRLLETIRSFAADELARQPPGELDALRTAHADWVAAWAARLAAHSEGPDSPQWLAEAVAEADNIRAAVHTYRRFGRSHDWLQLVVDAMTLWFEAGHEQEGEDYLSAALDAAGAEAPARAIGLTYWAWLRGTHNRREAAAAAVDALGLARRDDDPLVEAFAQQTLGDSLDDPDAAEAASLAVFEAADRSEGRPVRYGPTGPDAVRCGASYNLSARWLHRDLPQALTWQQEALRRAEREGDRRITAVNAARLAQALLLGGDTESARELLQRARELVSRMVTARWEDIVTYAEGLLAVHDGRTEDAELLLQRLFDSAVAAGRPLHTNLGAAALADLYTATDRPGEARSVLARARRAAAGAVDGTHLARLAVRRARLLRLDGLEDQAQSRLDAAAPALEPAALTPERVVWLVESAWLAAASGGPEPARALLEQLDTAAATTGNHPGPWERRWRERLDDLLSSADNRP